MTSARTPVRRRVLALAAGAITAGLAGCVDGSDAPVAGTGDDGDDGDDEFAENGDDHDHDHTHEIGHPETQVEVTMESADGGHHFVPHVVHVEDGGTVTWVLESGVHDTVAYHPENAELLPSASERRIPEAAQPWASDVYRSPGETYERTFEEEGIYDYVCTIVEHGHGPDRGHAPHGHHRTHEGVGMVGRVIVGWPELDADTQPAYEPPPDELPETAREELEAYDDRTRAALERGDGH